MVLKNNKVKFDVGRTHYFDKYFQHHIRLIIYLFIYYYFFKKKLFNRKLPFEAMKNTI